MSIRLGHLLGTRRSRLAEPVVPWEARLGIPPDEPARTDAGREVGRFIVTEDRGAQATLFVSDPVNLIVLDAQRPPRDYQDVYNALPPGAYVAAALRPYASSPRARVRTLLFLRFRVASLRRRLARTGAVDIRRFGLYPNLAEPTLAYELGAAAEPYVELGLLPRPRSWLFAFLRKSLHRLSGCHPSVAAFLIIGRKP